MSITTSGAVALRHIIVSSAARNSAGSAAIRNWRSTSINGTPMLRRPLSAATRLGTTFGPIRSSSVRALGVSGTWRSAALSGGIRSGRSLARATTYSTYRPASIRPGKKAPAYSCTTDTPAVAP